MFGALSEQPPAPVKMRNALGWWWHTPHDTLDKIDEANLVRDTKVYVHTLWRLLSDPVLPLDFMTHAGVLLEELGAIRASLDGRFAIDGLVAAAEALRHAAAAGGQDDAALMRASRALAPVYYTSGDRFAHDPALPLPAWPVLQPLRDLAKSERGSDAAHVLTVSATRAREPDAARVERGNRLPLPRCARVTSPARAGEVFLSHHPFTAPAVSPLIRNLRTASENTSTGSITSVPPAAILPHSQPT